MNANWNRPLLWILPLALCPVIASASLIGNLPGVQMPGPEVMGFELGNGRTIARNQPGNYALSVSDTSEVGYLDKFTEVIASLAEGTPRARLLINPVHADTISTLDDLVGDKVEKHWMLTNLNGLEGVKREITLSSGLSQLEIQLFRTKGELIVISLEGKADKEGKSSYSRFRNALETFHLLN